MRTCHFLIVDGGDLYLFDKTVDPFFLNLPNQPSLFTRCVINAFVYISKSDSATICGCKMLDDSWSVGCFLSGAKGIMSQEE